MILGTGGLITLYVALVATLLVLLFATRWRWQWKAVLIVVASLFYLVPYVSWPQLQGWPTIDDVPAEFNVVGMYVQPPNQYTGSEGVIYLWLAERLAGGAQGEPRAFKFGYGVKARDRMFAMHEKLKKGTAQAGRKSKEPPPSGRPGRLDVFGRLGQKSTDLEFYDAPAPQLPDK